MENVKHEMINNGVPLLSLSSYTGGSSTLNTKTGILLSPGRGISVNKANKNST